MDTKALRQKILDLAIRGKLVPQDPNDEPASVLIERIRAEKLQMVKDGKLKPKDIKNDTIIFKGDDNLHYEKFQDGTVKCIENEIPFDVPEGWAWTRFLAITINRDSERKPISVSQRTDVEKIYDYYGASGKIDKIDKYIFDEKLLLIGEDGANLVTRSKPIAFFAEGKYWVNNHAHCIDSPDKSILQFICFFINAISLEKYVTGSAQPKMTQDNMNSILVALPPYKEQQLISQQLDIIWVSIDKIEFEKENVLKLVDNAKSKILDLAIRGKLVLQNPYDEPASVLIERIRVEKEELIKQGKIKRDKKESVIFKGDDNSYYQDLPENWQITSLREITTPLTLNDGDWILSQNMSNIGDVKLLQLGSIGNMVYIDKGFKYLTKDTFKELSCTEIFSGYLLINRIISDKMCCCIVPNIDGTIITTVDTCWIAPSNASYDIKFLMYQLASSTFQKEVLLKASGTTRRRISKNNLINIALLLPPLSEQKRIVEAIEKIFATLDDIANQVE